MKTGINCIVLLINCLLLVSCQETETPVTPPNNEPDYLVPLTIGNQWSYRITSYTLEGDTAWSDTISFYISSDTVVNGIHWYNYAYDGPSIGSVGYRNDEDGFHITNWEYMWYSYPYPAEKGDSILCYKVVSLDTLLATPLGSVKCIQYQFIWYGMPLNTFIAPHLGIIRQESAGIQTGSSSNPYRSQDWDLVDFILK